MEIKNLVSAAGRLLTSTMLPLNLAFLVGSGMALPPANAQSGQATTKIAADPAPVKPGTGKRQFIPVKIDERLATGTIMGHPFNLIKATRSGNTITLDGGDMVASDAGKGQTKIIIEFPSAQLFANESYQIAYNKTVALTGKSETKAPTVTYIALDKGGAPVTVKATNGSKSDNLDYAMELRFYPESKGKLPGYIRLQIGSDPVTDIKGYFYAEH